MAFCKVLTVLVLIHNTGGLLGAEVRSSIVGGQDAPKDSWPFIVHLNITDGITKWRCGGTILSNEWVLTAAHCWDRHPRPNEARSMVWVGSHSLQRASARYMGITFVIPHPYYRALGSGYVNDIALVKLKKKIKIPSSNVDSVSLPNANDIFSSTSECWIIGWGYTATNVPLRDPETLQQLMIPLVPRNVCKEKYPDLTADMLCAGDLAGGKDACKGDYGGPLVCRVARGFVQVGIMSYGSRDGCGLPGHPGVYTKVSSYLRFINDYIHHGEEASAEV